LLKSFAKKVQAQETISAYSAKRLRLRKKEMLRRELKSIDEVEEWKRKEAGNVEAFRNRAGNCLCL
jgi:hypothetical protein